MCAIAGIIALSDRPSTELLQRRCLAMRDSMAHRGPDGMGLWVSPDGRCVLGQRRLSVIDISDAGRQPMLGGKGALTFNGEIYNFQKLRAQAEDQGDVFVSSCDTEVLLRGLEREGPDFLDRTDGMYAFGYYDMVGQNLILARDAMGEKPLYYTRTQDYFAFASELSALARLDDFDPLVECADIAAFLCFQYVPAPRSIYKNAAKLEPGRCVRILPDGTFADLRSRRFSTSDKAKSTISLDDCADQLEELLTQAVQDRLISDVPLGAFLSGGVDSSTIVALAARKLNRNLSTFSMGFKNAAESEHQQAAEIARHLGVPHRQEILDVGALPDLVKLIAAALDEPNGDSSCLPTYFLSKMTRAHVTVALSGDGGDEMFGGYGRYAATLRDQAKHDAAQPEQSGWTPGPAYVSSRLLFFTERDLSPLFPILPQSLTDALADQRSRIDADNRPLINRLREHDARTYMPGAVLAKVDRMSMRHSLEVRAPFLAGPVAQFASQLPADMCWDGRSGKAVLRRLAKRHLPAEWMDRPKLGFGLPMKSWGEAVVLKTVENLLRPGDNTLSLWLGQDCVDAFLARQRRNPMMYHLWAVAVLEHWLRRNPARPA